MDMSISLCIGGGGWRQPGGAAGGAVAAMAEAVKVAVSSDHINRDVALRAVEMHSGVANFGVRRRREIVRRAAPTLN